MTSSGNQSSKGSLVASPNTESLNVLFVQSVSACHREEIAMFSITNSAVTAVAGYYPMEAIETGDAIMLPTSRLRKSWMVPGMNHSISQKLAGRV